MPKKLISLSLLDIINSLMEGGDFMEIEQDPAREAAMEDAIRRMEWEGPAIPGGSNPTINPDLGKVEVGSNPTTHPLRKGRIRIPTALK